MVLGVSSYCTRPCAFASDECLTITTAGKYKRREGRLASCYVWTFGSKDGSKMTNI
jgi:hypothetical protein